jgi:hypothetical protein
MCFAGLNRLMRERVDGLLLGMGFVGLSGVGSGCSGIVIRARHEALPGSLEGLGRHGAGGNGWCGGRGGIAWTVERRSPGSRRL